MSPMTHTRIDVLDSSLHSLFNPNVLLRKSDQTCIRQDYAFPSLVPFFYRRPAIEFSIYFSAMDAPIHAGLEVRLCTDPEVIAQPDASKYFSEDEESRICSPDQPFDQHVQYSPSEGRDRSCRKACWGFTLMTVLCLTVALGAGVGTGLAAQVSSSFLKRRLLASWRVFRTSESAARSPVANSVVVITTQSRKLITIK